MDLKGFEPLTSSMPWKRAPNCATGPPREELLFYDNIRRQWRASRRAVLFGLLSCCLSGQAVAPTGTLRVAFIATNPMQGHVDAATGAISGPVRELSDALGKKLGVPVAITPMANVTLIIDGLKVHTVDVGFVAVEAARATQVDFSQAYLLGWSSYLVRADSPMRRVADLDAAGVRIGANAGDSQEIYLSRTLKRATMLRLTPANDWPTMLASGQPATISKTPDPNAVMRQP